MCAVNRTIEQEYTQLCQAAPTHTLKSDIVTVHPTACLPENYRTKNRYANVLPVESTRVRLDRDGSDVYINANHVKVGHVNEFICTQAPLVRTLDDFWMMVWDKNCPLICALNRLMEGNTIKGDRYWPEHGECVQYGEVSLSLQTTYTLDAFDITIRCIKLKRGSQERQIFQLHYQGWPDFGVPSLSLPIRELVNLIAYYQRVSSSNGISGPPIVHCSAGIGRTGTFLAIAIVMRSKHFRNQICSPEFRQNVQKLIAQNSMIQLEEELNSFLATFNISASVLSLRCQRNNGTVQNVAQYGFIYAALKDEILNPCKPSVACESVSGWHFREKICASLDTLKRKRSDSRKSYMDQTSCKKARGLAQSAPMIKSRGLGLVRSLVECPASRDTL